MKPKFSISVFLATCFGLGFSSIGPGTIGSFLAVPIYLFLKSNLVAYTIAVLFLILLGFITSGKAEKILETHDPKSIIIDEVAGALVAFYLIPEGAGFLIAAFLLFRFFDIAKIFPINKIEKMHGGKGMMLDDLVAGLYANIIVQVVARFVL